MWKNEDRQTNNAPKLWDPEAWTQQWKRSAKSKGDLISIEQGELDGILDGARLRRMALGPEGQKVQVAKPVTHPKMERLLVSVLTEKQHALMSSGCIYSASLVKLARSGRWRRRFRNIPTHYYGSR